MQCDSRKISIIGLGNVGVTAAYAVLMQNLADELVLVARDKAKAEGEKLDLEHGLPFLEPVTLTATDNYADIAGSDVVVITAGAAQEPGQSRLELAQKNIAIIQEIVPKIVSNAPDATILVVSNPVDVLTFHATKIANLPAGRVLGSGTLLDTARFRFHLSEFLNVQPRSIHAYILGEHGDSSFANLSSASIGGQPLTSFPDYTAEKAQAAFEKARGAAYQIIQAKGATYYAIGVVIAHLLKAITHNRRSVLPVSTVLTDYYGQSGVAASVPCIVGRGGVEQILKVQLSPEEEQAFIKSCEAIRQFCN